MMLTAADASTFRIGSEMEINRMGYGAMRLLGDRAFGELDEPGQASRVLHRVIELGVNFIDTADIYGPYINEERIAATLRPYPKNLVIGTKGGNLRFADPGKFAVNSSAAYLRQAIEGSLRRLRLETIDLYQVHRLDGVTPVEETIGALMRLRDEGKLRHIGLSEVGTDQLELARSVGPIATVQNLYNFYDRQHDDVLAYCEANGIGFIPWYPLAAGKLAGDKDIIGRIASGLGATSAQVALAWLLRKSPAVILIPGTHVIEHLEQNVASAALRLSDVDFAALDHLSQPTPEAIN